MTSRILTLAFVAATLFATPSHAQTGETPPAIDGAKTVTSADVKNMLGKALVLDVRKKATFAEGRLPGAKSITEHYDADKKTFAVAAFGTDKAKPIVIYGHGSDGWSAVAAVKSAVAAGYTNVNWMRTGWSAWSAEKMPTEQ
jgi:rhodanese-related sulfurtransferase